MHECNLFLVESKRELISLVLYFMQAGANGDRVQDSCLFCTGAFLSIEVQRGNEGMKHINYQQELVATAVCTKIMMEATKRIG